MTINKNDTVDVFCKKNKFQFTGKVHNLSTITAHIKEGDNHHIIPLKNLKKVYDKTRGH